MKIQIAVVQFPGSNCERETALAISRAGMEAISFLWNESHDKLANCDGYVIVGGFSYEDRGRAGIIAALDPLMDFIKQESEKGKPILGICNGAQILVEAGLVPGLPHYRLGMALSENKRIQNGQVLGTGYYNTWVNMRLADGYQYNAFTRTLNSQDILRIPVAHAEGRFQIPEGLLLEMIENGMHVFQYCDAEGRIVDAFPVNPNGSVRNIAAVSNKAGNVMAMMPHPERTPVGDPIFASMRKHIEERKLVPVQPLAYQPRRYVTQSYQPKPDTIEWIVDMIITDNQAVSVEETLRRLGYPVKIRRYQHFEMATNPADLAIIQKSSVLYSDRKEFLRTPDDVRRISPHLFLTRHRDDIIGHEKRQQLLHHHGLPASLKIYHGMLWQIEGGSDTLSAIPDILKTQLFFNPYAYDCYQY